jgi:hypothetical protein
MENDHASIFPRSENNSNHRHLGAYGLADAQPPQLARLNPEPLDDDPDHDTADEITYQEIYRQIP